MTTLDTMIAHGTLPPPDVIKIDVEGAEWDVFQGARQTLAAHRPPIVFECDVNVQRFGYTRRQLCDFLRSIGGYRFYLVGVNDLTPADDRMEDEVEGNLVALPPEQAPPDRSE